MKVPTAYAITDLAAYYDRQLANVEGMVVESVEADRRMVKLITKVIPSFQHNVCIGFRISINYYSNVKQEIGGIW